MNPGVTNLPSKSTTSIFEPILMYCNWVRFPTRKIRPLRRTINSAQGWMESPVQIVAFVNTMSAPSSSLKLKPFLANLMRAKYVSGLPESCEVNSLSPFQQQWHTEKWRQKLFVSTKKNFKIMWRLYLQFHFCIARMNFCITKKKHKNLLYFGFYYINFISQSIFGISVARMYFIPLCLSYRLKVLQVHQNKKT
jgi:hypothetical protein